jgi:hypothetical protein
MLMEEVLQDELKTVLASFKKARSRSPGPDVWIVE